jgi:hypothetical protein
LAIHISLHEEQMAMIAAAPFAVDLAAAISELED